MKTARIQLILFATSTALYLSMNGVRAQGTAFTYQGRLNVNGAPASGTYDFRYRLALDQFGNNYYGSSVLASGQVISNGLFIATLDFGAGAFNGGSYWLEVDVRTNGASGYTALSPLQPVTPTPYAIFSGTSSSAVNATTAATATSATTAATASAVGANGVNQAAIQNNAVTSAKIASGQVVKSLTAGANTLYDNVTLAQGNNVTITPNGQTVTIAATSGQNWSLSGNSGTTPGTQFVGTTDNQPVEFHVNGQRALRLEPDASSSAAPNVIGGSSNNIVDAGVVGSFIGGGGGYNFTNRISANYSVIVGGAGNTIQGASGQAAGNATISGGGNNTIQINALASTIAGGLGNTIQAGTTLATISGGWGNTIEVVSGQSPHYAVIGGGQYNTNGGLYATIPGGRLNAAAGNYATIPGGYQNIANGYYSLAAGAYAQATNNGAFVWGDSSTTQFGGNRYVTSTNDDSWTIRASGGVRIFTSPFLTAGAFLGANATAWSVICDRNAKKNFAPVEGEAVLAKLAKVPMERWNYNWEADDIAPHIGPMAQDFKAAFYPGRDDKSITTLEFDGVELAAIQGLNQKLEKTLKAKNAEIESLKQQNDSLAQRLSALERIVESLAENK